MNYFVELLSLCDNAGPPSGDSCVCSVTQVTVGILIHPIDFRWLCIRHSTAYIISINSHSSLLMSFCIIAIIAILTGTRASNYNDLVDGINRFVDGWGLEGLASGSVNSYEFWSSADDESAHALRR